MRSDTRPVALISGAGSGLGAAMAGRFAAEGWRVIVTDQHIDRAELAPYGVEVSVLCPAFVKTALTDSMRAPDDTYAKRVQRWMEHSGISADDVAKIVFEATRKPKFLLLTDPETRWQYRLKRWFPSLYFRILMRTMRKLMPKPEKN